MALRVAENAAPSRELDLSVRTLFVRATDPECLLPGGEFVERVRAELRRVYPETGDPSQFEDLQYQAATWASDEVGRYRALAHQACGNDVQAVLARRAVLGCAPLGLMSGAWLQWLSSMATVDDDITLRILALYASDVGVGHPRASRGSWYLTLLRQLQLSEHAAPPANLTLDQRIADEAFYLPALLLTMSRRPEDFLPEILGADLCLRTVGLLPPLTVVRESTAAGVNWTAIDPGAARIEDEQAAVERARVTVNAFLAGASRDEAERVNLGIGWALAALRSWSEGLYGELDASRDPAYEMAELLRLRAREGAVYHHDFKLEGRSLSDWLKDAQTDPVPLLNALAASRLIKPGRSEASPLVNSLIGERGPMFRVFSPVDVSIIRRWIDSLPANGSGTPAAPPRATGLRESAPGILRLLDEPSPQEGRPPGDLREAYYLLQSRTLTPALRRYALDYVSGWLSRSRHKIDKSQLPLPAEWTPEGLRPWLAEQHDRHAQEFEENGQAAVPSREEFIESSLQLAPLTMIDGAWLQGFTDYDYASSEIGFFLFETYWDELGNGEVRLNHPRIYRELIAEMGYELPPTGSREFAYWPGFKDSSFELPVYWLSVSRFPRTFMPEILGLNLAMELSGVGGTYRRARIALQTYGFSTLFVDLHNTIDNVATGHSAWAADAIDTYMAGIPASRGPHGRENVWDRIRTGYRSLNPPTGFWARRAARRAKPTV